MLGNSILEYYNYIYLVNENILKHIKLKLEFNSFIQDFNKIEKKEDIQYLFIYLLKQELLYNISKLINYNSNQLTFLNRLNNNINYKNFITYYNNYILNNKNLLFSGDKYGFVNVNDLFDTNTISGNADELKQTNFFNSSHSLFNQYKNDFIRSDKILIIKDYDENNKIYNKILKINSHNSTENIDNLSLMFNNLDFIIKIYLTLNKNYEYNNNKNNNIPKLINDYEKFLEKYKSKLEIKEEKNIVNKFKNIIENIKQLDNIENIDSIIKEETIDNIKIINITFDEENKFTLQEEFDLVNITEENKINYSFDFKSKKNIKEIFSKDINFLSDLLIKKEKCFTKPIVLKNFKIIYNIIKNLNAEELEFFINELITICLFIFKQSQTILADNNVKTMNLTDISITQIHFCYYIFIDNVNNFVDINSKVIYNNAINEKNNKYDNTTLIFNEQLNNWSLIDMNINSVSLIYKPFEEFLKTNKSLLKDYNKLETFYPKKPTINLKTDYKAKTQQFKSYYIGENIIKNSISLNINNNKTLKKIKRSTQQLQNNNIFTIDDLYELSPFSENEQYLYNINPEFKTIFNIPLKRDKYLLTTKLSNKIHKQRQKIKDNNSFMILGNNIGFKKFLINNKIIKDNKYIVINGTKFIFKFNKYILEDNDINKQFEYLYTNVNAFINLYSLLKLIANFINLQNEEEFIENYINDFFDNNLFINDFLLLLEEFGQNKKLFLNKNKNSEDMIDFYIEVIDLKIKQNAKLFGDISQIINQSKTNFYEDIKVISSSNNSYFKLIIFSYFILFTENNFIYKKILLNFLNNIRRSQKLNVYLNIDITLPESITSNTFQSIKISNIIKVSQLKNDKLILVDNYNFNILQNIFYVATNIKGNTFDTNKKFMHLNKKTRSRLVGTSNYPSSITRRVGNTAHRTSYKPSNQS